MATPVYQESSKFKLNVQSVYEKPVPGLSASNGYLTQIHSPSKRLKTGGKSTPEMQPIGMIGHSKLPQKKEASVYSNSNINTSIVSSNHVLESSQSVVNNSMLDDHQTPFEYQFNSRPSSLEKKVNMPVNPQYTAQIKKQLEINNYLRGQLVSESPQKTDGMVHMHVAQHKAHLHGMQFKPKEEVILQRPLQKSVDLNQKLGDVTPPHNQKVSIHYSNSLSTSNQIPACKQTRSSLGVKSSINGFHSTNRLQTSQNQLSSRGEQLNTSQDQVRNDSKPKSSLLVANAAKKKQDSINSQKQKFVINPSQPGQAKQAQIQNIILQQSKRQKSKTNVNSLQNSMILGQARKNEISSQKNSKELLQYIDVVQKGMAAAKEVKAVRTTQSSPRQLNLNVQSQINRNYYKHHISAPDSEKAQQLSSSNLISGSYSEIHNLPNELRGSAGKNTIPADDTNKSVSGQRKIQQQAKIAQPYAPVQRKDYFSVAPVMGSQIIPQHHISSQQVLATAGSKTPQRLDTQLVYQYQELSTIQMDKSDQVILDKRLSLQGYNQSQERKKSVHLSPNASNDQYLALIKRNNSRLSSNDESSTDQPNRRFNPILDGGTGTSNVENERRESAKREAAKNSHQTKSPIDKKGPMVYAGHNNSVINNTDSLKQLMINPKQPTTQKKIKDQNSQMFKKNDFVVQNSLNAAQKYAMVQQEKTKHTSLDKQGNQYRLTESKQDKYAAKVFKQVERSIEQPDQRQSLQVLFDNINQGIMDKRSNSQPSVDNVQLKLKPNILEPSMKQKEHLQSIFEQASNGAKGSQKPQDKIGAQQYVQNQLVNKHLQNISESDVRMSQPIENNNYLVGHHYYINANSGSSTAKSQVNHDSSKFKKQSSQVSVKRQPSQHTLQQSRPSSAVRRDTSSKGGQREGGNQATHQTNQTSGPRKQSRADKPLKAQEPFITSLENFAREMEEECQRLVTEEDENEIRHVASDINERAFYGKIIKTRRALEQGIKDYKQLSPRSQEIASVMQLVYDSFKNKGVPPITQISFYRIGKMLGRGAFGKVNLAMHKLVRKLVALKSLNKVQLTDEAHKAKLMKEVNLLLKLRHNHVVKIYETIETEKHIIIVMELCAGGDLLNYVRKRRRLKEPYAQKIFKQIIDGLCYIHAKQIAHRDIKLDNILLDGKGNVKIGDFGVSRQIQEGQIMREQCGTPAYIAPEILRNKGYSLNVDLWSAGVVLFAMLYGTVPFKAQSMEELHGLILKGKYLLKEDISQEARDMLRGLLEINPKKRLTIKQIYQHPWLQSMDKTIQLFTEEEREMIKKEYTYNDPSRYNRNENEEPVDCFTEHGFESEYNSFKNNTSKSVILAPFNSTMSENEDSISQNFKMIQSLMHDKPDILRFTKKCREIDRQYEFNNNGKLDNGVYHKQIANNSFEGDQNMSGTQGEEIIQYLSEQPSIQYNVKKKNDKDKVNLQGASENEAQQTFETFQREASQRGLDGDKIEKLVAFGYPEKYVRDQLEQMQPNYCTAGYYLLEMDQNYC